MFSLATVLFRNDSEAMKDLSKGIPEKWRLFFKLFCFINPQNIPTDSIESAFMFEQVCVYTICVMDRNLMTF